jgi:putative methyltransferase (TIGR04325 family)
MRVLRRLRGAADRQVRPVWTGVYARYADVPVRGPGFSGSYWTRLTRETTQAAIRALATGDAASPRGDRSLLPALAATVAKEQGDVAVLDFGGGMGIGYIDLRASIGPDVPVRFLVVEVEEVCAAGRTLFPGDRSITFVSRLDDVPAGRVDIVYISSALQYVDDWRDLLRRLVARGPAYVLFANVSAGDIPTFATAQRNVPGSVLAYWFIGLDDLTAVLRAEGYRLRDSTLSDRRLPRIAVPKSHRITRGRNLLFVRGG